MKFGYALLVRFGLFASKSAETSRVPDAFDLRLQRIGNRERHRQARRVLFRQQPRLMEA